MRKPASDPAPTGPAHAWPSRRPHRVGLACLLPQADGGAPRLLLDDAADATRAYERHYGSGGDGLALFELERPEDSTGADAIVVALAAAGGDLSADAISELQRIAESARPGTRVYALISFGPYEPGQMRSAADNLELRCRERDLAWSGAVAVAGGSTLAALWGSPRLGWLRRPASEATDALVLALRSGQEAGCVLVRPRLPRWLRGLIKRRANGPRK